LLNSIHARAKSTKFTAPRGFLTSGALHLKNLCDLKLSALALAFTARLATKAPRLGVPTGSGRRLLEPAAHRHAPQTRIRPLFVNRACQKAALGLPVRCVGLASPRLASLRGSLAERTRARSTVARSPSETMPAYRRPRASAAGPSRPRPARASAAGPGVRVNLKCAARGGRGGNAPAKPGCALGQDTGP
jgi:hypothetical protein